MVLSMVTNDVFTIGCLQVGMPIFGCCRIKFLHLKDWTMFHSNFFCSFYEKGLIYMIFIQFIVIQN
jgi:hypothetical protein